MFIRSLRLISIATSIAFAVSDHSFAEDYPKVAPYPAIRWKAGDTQIERDGRWFALQSIDDIPVSRIVTFTKQTYGDKWQKRFAEDLVQVLSEMGHSPGDSVKLVLVDGEGRVHTIAKAPLTEDYRKAIMKVRYPEDISSGSRFNTEVMHVALDAFKLAISDRWAYRHANGVDFDAAIATIRPKIVRGLTVDEFGVELAKIIALGIDGHASVDGYRLPRGGRLPFLIEPEGDRFVAFHEERTSFLAEGFPYIEKMQGRELAEWCNAAAVLVPKGSPEYIRRHALRTLRELDYVRGLMELPKDEQLDVELVSTDGKRRKTITLPVAASIPYYGVWPRGGSKLLEGNIGYLRLPSMDADSCREEITSWMAKFRDTKGLVVDVRDNGGGARDPLLLLYSYLAGPDDPPHVFSAAAYRLHWSHKADHLAERFMYTANSDQWTKAEREAVAAFAMRFKPRWQPPAEQFSEWHYITLSRFDDPKIYHYDKPVVVLMNGKCFSACDIFLAGLKGLKNVTLLGTPSGGGSALAQRIRLPGVGLDVRLASMASFQADGNLFDGHGVQPDILVQPGPHYHIGGEDNALQAAVQHINDL